MNFSNDIDGNKLIKKEAKGIGDDVDLGEVQEFDSFNIITEKGTVDKEKYYIPRNLIKNFDGNTVYFNITKDQIEQYKKKIDKFNNDKRIEQND
jgi:hypothetical protein